MPPKASTKAIAVYMAAEAIETMKKVSQQKGYKSLGEYVRDLIRQDVEASGKTIDFGLDDWGGTGRRGGKADP